VSGPADLWATGEPYEAYVGRWSRLVAADFVDWLGVPPGRRWLDVGCGTGAVTELVLARADPAAVVGVDPSAGFVEFARAAVLDERASFAVADAQALPFARDEFDAAVAGLVLNFVPEPLAAVREMARVTREGGSVAAYVWDYAGDMQMMRLFWDAAVELDRTAAEHDEGRRFPIARADALHGVFAAAGLEQLETRALDVPTHFHDFDDFWTPFLGGHAPAPAYALSLSERGREALRDRIRERLPVEPDGSIRLVARAWGARGRVGAAA
jgi:SAM-dependent methyltransferase